MTETRVDYRVPAAQLADAATGELPLLSTAEDVVSYIQGLGEGIDTSRWAAGDALRAYTAQFRRGFRLAELAHVAKGARQEPATLREWMDTAEFFPPESRTYGGAVGWSHYAIARRGHSLTEAQEWLDRAEELSWSCAEMRREIRLARGTERPAPTWDELVDKAAALLRDALDVRGVAQAKRDAIVMALEALEGMAQK